MTESELFSLSYEAIQALQTEETTFLTLLFGYVLAAYFFAHKLTVTQLFVFNTMYVVTTCGLIFNMWQHWTAVFTWVNAAETATSATVTDGTVQISIALSIYIALLAASIYFMWLVRSHESD